MLHHACTDGDIAKIYRAPGDYGLRQQHRVGSPCREDISSTKIHESGKTVIAQAEYSLLLPFYFMQHHVNAS